MDIGFKDQKARQGNNIFMTAATKKLEKECFEWAVNFGTQK